MNKIFKIVRSHYSRSTVLVSLILISSVQLMAQGSGIDSLSSYLEIAARNNPLVRQRFAEYRAALEKVPQAGSLSDPQLDVGVFLTPMELMSGKQVADIKLMQMFPWFGVLRNAKDEMSQMANARFEQFRDAKLQVQYDVQRSWNDLYRIRKDIIITEKNIEILNVVEKLALIRYKTAPAGDQSSSSAGRANVQGPVQGSQQGGGGMQGMTGQGGGNAPAAASGRMNQAQMGGGTAVTGLPDIYRIQIESADLRNNIALLRNQEQTAVATFNSYLNRTPAHPVVTDDTLRADTLHLSLGAVSDSINANNPMLKMIDYEQKSYQARKKMVTGMGYPMVGFGLNYTVIGSSEMSTSEMNGKDMVMPMVSVTLPIHRKKYKAMKREADIMSEAASLNYQSTANSLQTEYFQAVQLYQDAQRRVKLYEDQYQLATKSFDIMLKSFSSTSSGLTDVLRVRQQALDYETSKVQAVADLNTAIAWLRRLSASANNNQEIPQQ